MASSFNRVVLLGNLTRDIELRDAGLSIANFSLAVNDRRKVNGEYQECVDYIDITAFGRDAEIAAEYLSKGSPVMVEGKLRQEKWQDKDGNNRSKLVVICDRLVLLGKRQDSFAEAAAAEFEEEAAF